MRSHPVVGCLFILIGMGLLGAGAFGTWTPKDMPGPLPASIVIPFVLWQLALWALLFGAFFLRARGPGKAPRHSRFAL